MSENDQDRLVRTFVAVHPTPEQVASIEGLLERLARAVEAARSVEAAADTPSPVRWVAPHQAHVTLAFLGNVERERLGEIDAALAAVTAPRPPFDLAFRGVGAFPTPRRPQVIWLGVETGREALVELAVALRRALVPLGFEDDGAPFRPHLTLGRMRRGVPPAVRSVVASVLAEVPPETGTDAALIEEATSMASRIGSEGAVHGVIGRAALGGSRA